MLCCRVGSSDGGNGTVIGNNSKNGRDNVNDNVHWWWNDCRNKVARVLITVKNIVWWYKNVCELIFDNLIVATSK